MKRLWAMRRIGYLSDIAQENRNNSEVIDEIVQLSKKYGIISQYTSFLATDPGEQHRLPMPMSFARPASAPMVRASAAPAMNHHFHNAPGQIQIVDQRPVVESSPGIAGSGGGAVYGAAMPAPFYSLANSPVGRDAVLQAKASQAFKSASVASAAGQLKQGVKTVEDKTFYLKDGIWVDSDYDAARSPKPEVITFGSARYFDLVKSVHGIAKYLSAGNEVVLVYKNHCYKIVPGAQG